MPLTTKETAATSGPSSIAAAAQAADLELDLDDDEISIAISKAAVRGFVDELLYKMKFLKDA